MDNEPSLFERFLFEAPDDDPPDDDVGGDTGPPDIPDEPTDDGGGPPDMDSDPPDMGGDDDFGGDDYGSDDTSGDDSQDSGDGGANLQLDDKVSAIMNMNLYQRYLSLLNNIGSQLTTIKNNGDVLYTLSSDSVDIIEGLKRLDENIRLYIKHSFLNKNYSMNLLFFNKCLNLLKLLNDVFDQNIRKGIKDMK